MLQQLQANGEQNWDGILKICGQEGIAEKSFALSFVITLQNVKMLGMSLASHKTPEDTALANIMC